MSSSSSTFIKAMILASFVVAQASDALRKTPHSDRARKPSFTVQQGACRDPEKGRHSFGGWCDCGKIMEVEQCFAKAQEMPSMVVVEVWTSTQACVPMGFASVAPTDCPAGCRPEAGEHVVGKFQGDGRPFVQCLIPSAIDGMSGEDAAAPVVGTSVHDSLTKGNADGANHDPLQTVSSTRTSPALPDNNMFNKTYWGQNLVGQKLADVLYLADECENRTHVLSRQITDATKKKDSLSEELRLENAQLARLLQEKSGLDEKIRIFTQNMHKVEKEFQRIMGDSQDAMNLGAANITALH